MIYIKSCDLIPGMILGKPIHYSDLDLGKAIELSKGYRLTDLAVERLNASHVDGAYIEGADDNMEVVKIIDDEIKTKAVSGIQQIAGKFAQDPDSIDSETVRSLEKTTESLVNGLNVNNGVLVNIADLKMYDDYTYHHSLSVAVMALAIGIELGLDNGKLQELTLAGLLHDIGKVAVPLEIINKPGRLTPQEFEVMKNHPLNAGLHLWNKKLIPYDVYGGIICHHEKYDGTGYPWGLKGEKIPYFGRVLKVADVYDALTSNRSYRRPSPPSEAIEYIMGGINSDFDEKIVKAFLRKIAAYPVGIKVMLSNGEVGTVLKNYAEHPLRPVISIDQGAQIYDLYNDINLYSIVVTGIAENEY